jgi:leucyl-tRNA synthetase
VAALMELFNEIADFNADPAKASEADVFAIREALESLVIMLTPFAPHVAEEMWEGLGHSGGLLSGGPRWPIADPELARSEELEIPIQVNGKLRSRVIAAPDASEEDLRTAALADERVQALTEGHEILKVIVVPRRLVNIVIG